MKYFKVDDDKFIEFNEENGRTTVISKAEIETSIAFSQQRLAEIPDEPSDEEMLVWARQNFPRVDYSTEKRTLQEVIDLGNERLSAWQTL